MAENHDLRLRIDASAAKRGSREFTGAIEAVKRAVRDLERDSTGAFTQLKKNMQTVSRMGNMKVSGVDKQSVRDLESFARTQQKALRATLDTKKQVQLMVRSVRSLADAYSLAKRTTDGFNAAIRSTNSGLQRQINLASQARSAVRQVRMAPMPTREPTGGGMPRANTGAAESTIALQQRVTRAIDQSTLAAERLTTSLMKVGGFQAMSEMQRSVRKFQADVSRADITTKQFAAAKHELDSATTKAQTSLTTMTAKIRDEARAMKEAETEAKRKAEVDLSSAAAMRKAELEAARLTERLRGIGDTSGVERMNAALNRLRSQMAGGMASSLQIRQVMSQFSDATNKAKVSLVQYAGQAERAGESSSKLARQERDAANAARRLERDMRAVAGTNNAARGAFRDATGGMRGLENAFNSTYQIGTAFRALIGSITLGTFIRSVYQAGASLDQFRVTMEIASGSAKAAGENVAYIDDLARRLGTNLRYAREDFSKFAVASNIAGVSMDTTKDIFESVAMAMSTLGKGAEDQRLAFMALEQMMSKGKISSEELRRQLGERLPGAVNLMANALDVSTSKLQDLLKAGAIDSADALPKFAEEVRKTYGPAFENATKRASYNLGTFQVEIEKFLETVSQSGFMQTLAVEFRELTDVMRSSDVQGAAERLGMGFRDAAQMAGDAIQFLVNNIEGVARAAKAIAIGVLARQLFLFGNAAVVSSRRLALLGISLVENRRKNIEYAASADSAAAAQQRLTASAGRSVGVLSRTAGRLGMLSRGLAALAGPAGVAIAALSFLPVVFQNTGAEADEASITYERAMRRMKTSTFSFVDQAREVEEATKFETLQENMEAISEAHRVLAQIRVGKGAPGLSSALEGLDSVETTTEQAERAIDKVRSLSQEIVNFTGSPKEAAEKIDELGKAMDSALANTNARAELKAVDEALSTVTRAYLTWNNLRNESVDIAGDEALRMEEYRRKLDEANASMSALFSYRKGDDLSSVTSGVRSELDGLNGGIQQTAATMSRFISDLGDLTAQETADIKNAILEAAEGYDGTVESVNRLQEALDNLDPSSARNALSGMQLAEHKDRLQALIDEWFNVQPAAENAAAGLETASNAANSTASAVDNISLSVQGLAQTMSTLFGISAGITTSVDSVVGDLKEKVRIANIENPEQYAVEQFMTFGDGAEAMEDLRAAKKTAEEHLATLSAGSTAYNAAYQQVRGIEQQINEGESTMREWAGKEYSANQARLERLREARKAARKSESGGSSRSKKSDTEKYLENLPEKLSGLKAESLHYEMLSDGMFQTAEAAKLAAEATMLGIDIKDKDIAATLDQIDAEQQRIETLKRLAKDPVKDWMDSVPTWREGTEQIKADTFGELSDTISNFIQTGKMDFASFFDSIVSSYADMMADNLVKGMFGEEGGMFGEGGLLGGMGGKDGKPYNGGFFGIFGGGNKEKSSPEVAAMQTGSATAATTISQGMQQAGRVVSNDIRTAMTGGAARTQQSMQRGGMAAARAQQQAGTQSAAQIGNATRTSGQQHAQVVGQSIQTSGQQHAQAVGAAANAGAGGNMFSNMFKDGQWFNTAISMFGFSEGGISHGRSPHPMSMPLSAFAGAPHYAEGTPNTSEIPAVLHPNEAVVPLSRGRKIPVEMSGQNGGNSISVGDVYVTVESAEGESDTEQAQRIGEAVRQNIESLIDLKIAENMQYGGAMNPRGRM